MSATTPTPVITPVHPMWLRVIRPVKIGDRVIDECIAETRDLAEASVIASREPFRAVVKRWDSRTVFNNWKPIEERSEADVVRSMGLPPLE